MLSTDRKIFEPNSAVASRMIDYGQVLGDLRIIVLGGHYQTKKLSDQVTVYPTDSWSRLMYIPDAISLIIRLNRLGKADWISAQDPFETGLAAWITNLWIRTKLQLQLHTDVFSPFFAKSSWLNQIRVVLARFLLPRADRVRVVSQKIFQSLTAGPLTLPAEKITILPVLVDGEELGAKKTNLDLKQKYPQFERIVLMASRFELEKDFSTALRAFKQIASKRPKTGLVIVGEGSEQNQMNKLINSLGLMGNVIVEAWTDDLFAYFTTADLYLLTSLFEGYGRTLVEAGWAGTPFVSTDVGCARELLMAGLAGLVVPVGDRQAISDAISALLAKNLVGKAEKIIPPDSIHFLAKAKFLELYKKSFE